MGDTSDEIRKRLEREDYGHELAGLEVGRMARFGIGGAKQQELKEQKRKERAYRDALDRLLATDPEYRRLYEEFGDKLRDAETNADQQIDLLVQALADQQALNEGMRERAPKIDGKAVFRYANGRVVGEDGNEIDVVIAAEIVWPEGAPSAEDYFAGVARENALNEALDEWNTYRNDTLGNIRHRHDDRENPMTKDDIREALDKIEELRPTEATINTSVTQEAEAAPIHQAFPEFN